MSLYAIADLHLSLATPKPMDIFQGWSDYVCRLESQWKESVTDEDTVVIAGDISWAMTLDEAKQDFKFINALPGRKIFIKGNHDYWWSTQNKINCFLEKNGLDTICTLFNSAIEIGDVCVCGTKGFLDEKGTENTKIRQREARRLEASIKMAREMGKKPIVFLHYPPVYSGNVCEEILEVLLKYQIKSCYYGHIHGDLAAKRALQGEYNGVELKLISCDYLNFCPLLVQEM